MEAYYVICRYFCFSLFFERSSLSSVFQRSTGSWAPCEEFTLLRNIILYKTFFKICVFDLTNSLVPSEDPETFCIVNP